MSIALSILDLAPVSEGISTEEALRQTTALARLGDDLGYTRLWYAEHHGMPSIASAVPELLIGNAAAATKSIRVGSGGVMLLNHRPLRVVETFRTLNGLHPNRIDLGLGRAPGGDGYAMRALQSGGGEEFSHYLAEMMAFEDGTFPDDHPFSRVMVSPGGVALPPMWLLGSSGASASAAGQLGIGYAFASHFSATPPGPAFAAYREAFTPTGAFPEPRAILGVSALVAPTDEEADYLSKSQELMWALFLSGELRRLVPPEEAIQHTYTAQQRGIVENQKKLWLIGSPETIKRQIMEKVEESGATEVMVTTSMWSYELRQRSYRLLAEAFGLTPRA